jgi:hypothetical protein
MAAWRKGWAHGVPEWVKDFILLKFFFSEHNMMAVPEGAMEGGF